MKKILGIMCLLSVSGLAQAAVVANSATGFSDVQGGNNWYYGYVTGPSTIGTPTLTYSLNDYMPLDIYGTVPGGATGWYWSGTGYLYIINGRMEPYTDGVQEYRPVARWKVDSPGKIMNIHATFSRPSGYTEGYGVYVGVVLNGQDIGSVYVAPTASHTFDLSNNGAGYMVQAGDVVDFIVSPQGEWGSAFYGDYTDFNATIDMTYGAVFYDPQTAADSVGEFSGVQGQSNWFYGYETDISPIFVPFNDFGYSDVLGVNAWSQSSIVSTPNLYLSAGRTQPYSDGTNEYRTVRRWQVEQTGKIVRISGHVERPSSYTTDGLGVVFSILIDGKAVYSVPVSPASGTIAYSINNANIGYNVQAGQYVDFVVSPNGMGDTAFHGDFTDVSATVEMVYGPQRNGAFTVPATGPIAVDGSLADWTTSTDWSQEYIYWYGSGLKSTTKAKFAWNDAADMLYVAIQTTQANGGHAVLGFSKNINGIPTSGIGSTQLCFDPIPGGSDIQIRNEIQYYKDKYSNPADPTNILNNWGGGGIQGVQARYSVAGGVYTYEIAIPFWSDWRLGQMTVKQSLTNQEVVYLYAVMEDVIEGGNGTDLTYTGNAGFPYGSFNMASALTLTGGQPSLPGDANGDKKVDVSDLGILAANYGLTGGATWAKGDFNNDGKVDVSDLGILAANYGAGTVTASDFNADAIGSGLAAGVKEETPAVSNSGCSAAGLPLIAGVLLVVLVLGNLKVRE